MPSYRILGIYSYANNLKKVKLYDPVIFKNEKYNVKSQNAVGVYCNDMKIGYLPIEKNQETEYFKNNYKISKLSLNGSNPNVEISRYYPDIGTLEDIEYPIIKKLKYKTDIIEPKEETVKSLVGLVNYFKTKKIKVKKIAVSYENEDFINLLIEVGKSVTVYWTVTNNYFTKNIDKYEELYENKLIDNTFYRNLLFHRLECYYEANYTGADNAEFNFDPNCKIRKEVIHGNMQIDKNTCILYMRYLINKENYITIDMDLLNNIQKVFDKFTISIGKFTYSHKLKVYDYINFITDDYLIDIVDDDYNVNNIIVKGYLANKNNICIYNPSQGYLEFVDNINFSSIF